MTCPHWPGVGVGQGLAAPTYSIGVGQNLPDFSDFGVNDQDLMDLQSLVPNVDVTQFSPDAMKTLVDKGTVLDSLNAAGRDNFKKATGIDVNSLSSDAQKQLQAWAGTAQMLVPNSAQALAVFGKYYNSTDLLGHAREISSQMKIEGQSYDQIVTAMGKFADTASSLAKGDLGTIDPSTVFKTAADFVKTGATIVGQVSTIAGLISSGAPTGAIVNAIAGVVVGIAAALGPATGGVGAIIAVVVEVVVQILNFLHVFGNPPPAYDVPNCGYSVDEKWDFVMGWNNNGSGLGGNPGPCVVTWIIDRTKIDKNAPGRVPPKDPLWRNFPEPNSPARNPTADDHTSAPGGSWNRDGTPNGDNVWWYRWSMGHNRNTWRDVKFDFGCDDNVNNCQTPMDVGFPAYLVQIRDIHDALYPGAAWPFPLDKSSFTSQQAGYQGTQQAVFDPLSYIRHTGAEQAYMVNRVAQAAAANNAPPLARFLLSLWQAWKANAAFSLNGLLPQDDTIVLTTHLHQWNNCHQGPRIEVPASTYAGKLALLSGASILDGDWYAKGQTLGINSGPMLVPARHPAFRPPPVAGSMVMTDAGPMPAYAAALYIKAEQEYNQKFKAIQQQKFQAAFVKNAAIGAGMLTGGFVLGSAAYAIATKKTAGQVIKSSLGQIKSAPGSAWRKIRGKR